MRHAAGVRSRGRGFTTTRAVLGLTALITVFVLPMALAASRSGARIAKELTRSERVLLNKP